MKERSNWLAYVTERDLIIILFLAVPPIFANPNTPLRTRRRVRAPFEPFTNVPVDVAQVFRIAQPFVQKMGLHIKLFAQTNVNYVNEHIQLHELSSNFLFLFFSSDTYKFVSSVGSLTKEQVFGPASFLGKSTL